MGEAAKRTEDRPGSWLHVLRSLFLVLLVVAYHEASDRISDHFGIETGSFDSPWKFPMIAIGTLFGFGVILGLGCMLWGKQSLRDLGWTFSRPLVLVGLGLLIAAVMIGLVYGVYFYMAGWEGVTGLTTAIVSLSLGQRIFFALMGLKIALFEETLFRGDLLLAIERKAGPWIAMIGSSVVFAIHHRGFEPIPLTMKFVMGMLFAVAMVRTRSLLPSTIGHTLLWAIVAEN